MKIQSISNNNFFTYQKRNQSQPKFTGSLSVNQLKKLPLEKKLTHLFSNCNSGDIIAIGKSLEEVQKGLVNSIANFSEIVKRILFIKHGGLSVPLAFDKDPWQDFSCINIGEKSILISSGDKVVDFEPQDSYMIQSGDVIINNNVNIPINEQNELSVLLEDIDDINLLMNPENFATQTFGFEDIQEKKVKDANLGVLTSLTKLQEDVQQSKKTGKLSFDDVGGMDETIETLKRSILYPIKFPFAYENVAVNRGIMLYGKPGTGKTLLAEALAGESNAEFLKISGTDFESKWVGETEGKWRELFNTAKEKQPSIIFIDEFDAVVKERGRSTGSNYGDKVVNQILSLMSDLEKGTDNVFVIATTNKPETIDSAIMRSGRFGKQIEVLPPDRSGLESILDIHTRGKLIDSNLDKEVLLNKFVARQFTGADVKHVTNEAHTNSWIRNGVYEKMDAGILTPNDMAEVAITSDDFNLAIQEWDKSQTKKSRNPIGFNK